MAARCRVRCVQRKTSVQTRPVVQTHRLIEYVSETESETESDAEPEVKRAKLVPQRQRAQAKTQSSSSGGRGGGGGRKKRYIQMIPKDDNIIEKITTILDSARADGKDEADIVARIVDCMIPGVHSTIYTQLEEIFDKEGDNNYLIIWRIKDLIEYKSKSARKMMGKLGRMMGGVNQ